MMLKAFTRSSQELHLFGNENTVSEYMYAMDTNMNGSINREEFSNFMEAAREVLF